ncbi:MAG: hypothetical protein FWD31_04610 [Planctomycetaceae bacterium]|nr:hypothetical protein [Planctomycetaceae bacterium]
MSQEIPQPYFSHVDEILRETIIECLENFSELQNEEDFLQWMCMKAKKVRKRMMKNQRKNDKNGLE